MTTATIQGIETLTPIPVQGHRYLSINLAIADTGEVWIIARELGFSPHLVQIPYRFGTEIHCLLWSGEMANAPQDLEDRIEILADRLPEEAIRHVWQEKKVA